MTDYDKTAEERAEERLQSFRRARQDRILANVADAFDCSSETDVVCPFCGQWFDGALFADRKGGGYQGSRCGACGEHFELLIVTQRRYTTTKPLE
ncbi:MAG: hypothetical protein M8858_08180 [marine benthic group bacterium]|nr:hypothetical protein [Gemmatimonadota bacterium]